MAVFVSGVDSLATVAVSKMDSLISLAVDVSEVDSLVAVVLPAGSKIPLFFVLLPAPSFPGKLCHC